MVRKHTVTTSVCVLHCRCKLAMHEQACAPLLNKDIFYTNIRQYASKGAHSCEPLPQPFILPHELFAYLMATDRSKLTADGDIESFWASVSGQEWCAAQLEQIDPTKAIPVGLHGDDATNGKLKLLVFSWSGLLPRGSSASTRFLITAIPFSSIVPDVTVPEILDIITSSFAAMRAGVFPGPFKPNEEVGHKRFEQAGKPLTQDSCNAILVDVRGDWKFHVETFGLTKSYRHQQICHVCGCAKESACQVFFESPGA